MINGAYYNLQNYHKKHDTQKYNKILIEEKKNETLKNTQPKGKQKKKNRGAKKRTNRKQKLHIGNYIKCKWINKHSM